MIAFKGFNENLVCTMGDGPFQYEIGKTYKENEAKCASTGFHCVEEPIEVLSWYNSDSSRYCIVEAGGDINEDGNNKISCTEMKIIKEISLQQLAVLECKWLMEHPEREYSRHVLRDSGKAEKEGIVIVRGKNPKAAGDKGSTIFLLKEDKNKKTVSAIGVYEIDGIKYKPDTFYGVSGRKCRCTKKSLEN